MGLRGGSGGIGGKPREIEMTRQLQAINTLARLGLAFVWLYHGLVPKLLFMHPDELLPLLNAGMPEVQAVLFVKLAGWAEVALGLALLVLPQARWPYYLTAGLMIVATFTALLYAPILFRGAFNPASLNVLVFLLAVIGLASSPHNPKEQIEQD
jgi:uncharacterized membrane protein YphA (DoxX/SURF4 family)